MFPEITKKKVEDIRYPAAVELKLDGELVQWNGQALINSYGNIKHSVDVGSFPAGCVLWGELYYDTGKNFYSELQRHQTSKDLKVMWFDVVEANGHTLYGSETYRYRRMALQEITPNVIPACKVATKEAVIEVYNNYIKKGYEGVVVKPQGSLSCKSWVKLKRSATCKLYAVGVRKNAQGGGKRSIAVGTGDKVYGCCSVIGWLPVVELIAEQKILGENKDYWFVSPKVVLEIEYQHLTPSGKLRNPFIKRICDYREKIQLP